MTIENAIAEFRDNASKASYHHADDSGREWPQAKPYERRCQEIYDAADAETKAALAQIAKGYLIRLRTS